MGRWARRPVRQRFTLLFAALILVSGAGVLAVTNLLAGLKVVVPAPGQDVPAAERIGQLQAQLADLQAAQSRQLVIGSLVALALMAAVSLVAGQAVADRVLRPLRAITLATRRITAENLHSRLAVPGPDDEVKELADTIDDLLGRLEAAFAAQRRFVANAAHELRTPLATMRAAMDVSLAKAEPAPRPTLLLTDRLRDELDRTDALLEGLLELARAQHAGPTDRSSADHVPVDHVPVDLHQLVAEALAARAGIIAQQGLSVETGDHAQVPGVSGAPALLARLVGNLVDNAIVHNEPGGWLRVTTVAGPGATELVVESGGPRLDPDEVAQLTEPFRRIGPDRTGGAAGSGLGLSIVAAVIAAHGGRLDLLARPEGGLRVTVTLPTLHEKVAV